eukprot:gene7915-10743_t
MLTDDKVVVIGAGVVGLSVALRIKEVYGVSINVKVISESFLEQTTSYGSGGLWEPYQIAGTSEEKINEWGAYSFQHFAHELRKRECSQSGVQLLTCYQLFEESQELKVPFWKNIVYNFQILTDLELKSMGLYPKYNKGYSFGTYVVEQKYYLQYLTNKLKLLGVEFEQRKVNDLNEFLTNDSTKSVACVINCTGLGAIELLNDDQMYPIRGQVLRLRAPWINNVWFFGTSYIIPNVDSIVVGGTAQKGDFNTIVDLNDSSNILNDVYKIFPSLQDANLLSSWVGLRPGRTPLRLESETITGSNEGIGDSLNIIHCYGHGGSGVTIAMGCANDVVMNHLVPIIQKGRRKVLLSDIAKYHSKL